MKFTALLVLLGSFSFGMIRAHADELKPDLVPSFRFSGTPLVHNSGYYLVPMRITIRNSGRDVAGRFKISAEYNHNSFGGMRVVPFSHVTSAGRSVTGDNFYAWTNRALFVGQAIEFNAFITIPKTVPRGEEIIVSIWADSCVGDEFEPFYCRVHEINEANNRTSTVSVRLP